VTYFSHDVTGGLLLQAFHDATRDLFLQELRNFPDLNSFSALLRQTCQAIVIY